MPIAATRKTMGKTIAKQKNVVPANQMSLDGQLASTCAMGKLYRAMVCRQELPYNMAQKNTYILIWQRSFALSRGEIRHSTRKHSLTGTTDLATPLHATNDVSIEHHQLPSDS